MLLLLLLWFKRENYDFLCADCNECVQTIILIPIKWEMLIGVCIMWMTLCEWPMQKERNELRNFPDAMDGMNIIVAKSQDTGESELW